MLRLYDSWNRLYRVGMGLPRGTRATRLLATCVVALAMLVVPSPTSANADAAAPTPQATQPSAVADARLVALLLQVRGQITVIRGLIPQTVDPNLNLPLRSLNSLQFTAENLFASFRSVAYTYADVCPSFYAGVETRVLPLMSALVNQMLVAFPVGERPSDEALMTRLSSLQTLVAAMIASSTAQLKQLLSEYPEECKSVTPVQVKVGWYPDVAILASLNSTIDAVERAYRAELGAMPELAVAINSSDFELDLKRFRTRANDPRLSQPDDQNLLKELGVFVSSTVATMKQVSALHEASKAAAEAELKAKAAAEAELKAKAAAEAELAAKLAALLAKKVSITCIKGKLTRKITSVKPKCPTGWKKQA